ncbi:MAG: XRE family transcriptional regulator [Deltaproteobacteria bacterium]|nr:MAG: XRE family transcriptional regulator [Deltaproteobacteria bacterium]
MAKRRSCHSHGRSDLWNRPEVVAAIECQRRSLGDELRRLRRRAGLSQEALAERAGVHAKHVQRIERGRCNPNLSTLVALAAALEVSVGRLLR